MITITTVIIKDMEQITTGMRAVNAIPAVVAARPGLLSALDIPLVPGLGVMHRDLG